MITNRSLAVVLYTLGEVPLVNGKLVRIQHGPATVSAEKRSTMPLFRQRNGKADRFDEAQVRRPASAALCTALEGGARYANFCRRPAGLFCDYRVPCR